MKSIYFFVAVFVVALMFQVTMWQYITFTDENFWIERLVNLRQDLGSGNLQFDLDRHPAHPGTPPLMLAAIFNQFGWSPADSLRISVSLLVAMIVAGVAAWARILRPHSWWWLAASGLILFNSLNLNLNPLDAVISPLVVLIFLLVLWHIEKRQEVGLGATLLLGFCLGVAAATRLHIMVLLVGPILVWLAMANGWRRATLIGASALVWTLGFVPWLGQAPGEFLRAAGLNQLVYFTEVTSELILTDRLTLLDILFDAPLAVISFTWALVVAWQKH